MNAKTVYRSRGALSRGKRTRGQPSDIVEVSADRIAMRPLLGPDIILIRSNIQRVEVRRVRQPLWWSNDFYFRMVDGTRAPKLFRPLRTKHFLRILNEFNYAVLEFKRHDQFSD
jgi:hypothetical protein